MLNGTERVKIIILPSPKRTKKTSLHANKNHAVDRGQKEK